MACADDLVIIGGSVAEMNTLYANLCFYMKTHKLTINKDKN